MMKTNGFAPSHASRGRRIGELALRAGVELGAAFAALPWLRLAPRGDGHAVMVLPGLGASDASTRMLRAFLRDRGYAAKGWGLGRNFGPRVGVERAMLDAIDRLRDESGRTVSLVGWSLGGLYASALAAKRPEAVRSVITLGSPLHPPQATAKPTPGVPTTSIYSRSDEVVPWRCSVETEGDCSENIEVVGSHLGLGFNPAVLFAVSDRLAQAEGQWQPFERTGWRQFVFPDPRRDDTSRTWASEGESFAA
jgi:pimeloyl-ACP methyl ester carboxylesterase